MTGAAYATVTAQMLIAVAGLAYFFTRKTALRFDLQMFKLKPKYLKNIVVSGFPFARQPVVDYRDVVFP